MAGWIIKDRDNPASVLFKDMKATADEGVPTGILSGGQYDNLMAKMNKKQKAIGFAVYLDELDKLSLLGGKNND